MIEIGKVIKRSGLSVRLVSWLVVGLFTAIVTILLTGNYARKEEVAGHVVTGNLVRAVVDRPGHIEEILVSPGQVVKRGQPLIRVRSVEPDTISGIAGQAGTSASITRLERILEETHRDEEEAASLRESQAQAMRMQLAELEREEALNERAQASIKSRLALAEARKGRYQRSLEDGAVSETAYAEAAAGYESVLQELASSQNARVNLRQRRIELIQRDEEVGNTLSMRRRELERSRNDISDRIDSLRKMQGHVVLSPADGQVDAIAGSVGDLLEAGKPIVLLQSGGASVDTPMVRLNVTSSAIGFAQPGTPVLIRIDAFPYQRFGVVAGSITQVTSGTLHQAQLGRASEQGAEATYLVDVRLRFSEGSHRINEAWLKDGMTVKAAIRLEELSLLEWLFLPVLKGVKRNPGYLSVLSQEVQATT